jgi:hypothetical protein
MSHNRKCQLCERTVNRDGKPLEVCMCRPCGRWMCLSCFLKRDGCKVGRSGGRQQLEVV